MWWGKVARITVGTFFGATYNYELKIDHKSKSYNLVSQNVDTINLKFCKFKFNEKVFTEHIDEPLKQHFCIKCAPILEHSMLQLDNCSRSCEMSIATILQLEFLITKTILQIHYQLLFFVAHSELNKNDGHMQNWLYFIFSVAQ